MSDLLNYSFSKYKIKFNAANPIPFDFATTLTITNPTDTGISVNGVNGVIVLGTTKFADFASNNPFTIPANGNVDVQITARIISVAAIRNIWTAIKSGQNIPIIVNGSIRTQLGISTFSEQIASGTV